MARKFVEKELKRCRALLSAKRVGAPLTETPPERDPRSIGAKGGTGFAATPGVAASVYIFEDADKHDDALEALQAVPAPDGVYELSGTNGGLLFFGRARIDGPGGRDAKFLLSDMLSAFSGDE